MANSRQDPVCIIFAVMDQVNNKIMRLSALPAGKTAQIHSFTKSAPELILMEMGCVPGAFVQMDRTAPLGDPLAIRIAGYCLAIRKQDADHVWVQTL